MYITKINGVEFTFDWITPVNKKPSIDLDSLIPGEPNKELLLCFVQYAFHIDIWKCKYGWDYKYDLRRYYEIMYNANFDKLKYFFTRLTNFTFN